MNFFAPLLRVLFHAGYFGPLLMGILDSSFLILPFGNDLLVVALVAQTRRGIPLYVLSAAVGSSIGAFLLAIVARKLGEQGIRKMAGDKRYDKLRRRVGTRSGFAVALAGLAPPPFPFTSVIAAVSAIDYPIWRIVVINFLARGVRFLILAFLALKFGKGVLAVAKSKPFEWGVMVFIALCILGSAFSIWKWLRRPRRES
jgi:membrane protein YqaA with SNARE-associated domain